MEDGYPGNVSKDQFITDCLSKLGRTGLNDSDVAYLERTSSILRVTSEIEKLRFESEKLRAETENLRRGARSEASRFWITVIAPIVGSAAVVATLLFQIHQFSENSRLQRLANEDTAFRNFLQTAKLPSGLSTYTSFTLLKSFLNSPEYGKQAREIGATMLGGTANIEGFTDLFSTLFSAAKYTDLPELARVSRMVNSVWNENTTKEQQARDQLAQLTPSDKGPIPSDQPHTSPLSAADRLQAQIDHYHGENDTAQKEESIITRAIVKCIRDRPAGAALDLSGVAFWQSDLAGLNLQAAVLEGTEVQNSSVKGTDLSAVVQFDESRWMYTVWWNAAKISPPLLKYLEDNYPFDPTVQSKYHETTSEPDYSGAVARLKKAGS